MTPRPFGTTGSLLSPIAFGAKRITADADGTSSVLRHALERGITAIDTARNYGDSEAIVGRTLRAWRGLSDRTHRTLTKIRCTDRRCRK